MTVFTIVEDNYGLIGIAANERAVKQFLLDADWVNSDTDIWIRNKSEKYDGHYTSLKEQYGNNWEESFFAMNANQLEDMGFFIHEEEVYE